MERLNAIQFGVTELQSMPTRMASGRMEALELMDVMHQNC
jgi:hypothetical protein